jgi:hypothetical protein
MHCCASAEREKFAPALIAGRGAEALLERPSGTIPHALVSDARIAIAAARNVAEFADGEGLEFIKAD